MRLALSTNVEGGQGSGREVGRGHSSARRGTELIRSGGSLFDCFKACWILLRFVVV